jgi:CheY-like chemotaxis protein
VVKNGLASGEEALQIISRKAPHLILLDLMMPGLDREQGQAISRG